MLPRPRPGPGQAARTRPLVKRTVLGHLVGAGLALSAATAAAQNVPGVTQGAPTSVGPATSVPVPTNVPAVAPEGPTQNATPDAQGQAAQNATQSTQQQAEVSSPEGPS